MATLAERGLILRAFEVEYRPADPSDYGMRHGVPVDTLVLHTTEGGTIDGAISWWGADTVIASAHYVMDGRKIVQVVPEELAAYHAGSRSMNRRSIGIEVVGHASKAATWTPEVMKQLIMLSADIVKRHGIPVTHQAGPGICGHMDVPDPFNPNMRGGASHHGDPGPHFPWQTYLDALRAEIKQQEMIA